MRHFSNSVRYRVNGAKFRYGRIIFYNKNDVRVILRPNVEINCYDILCDIFSGARGMRNHKTGSGSLRCLPLLSQPTRSLNAGLLVRADAEKKIKSLMMIK